MHAAGLQPSFVEVRQASPPWETIAKATLLFLAILLICGGLSYIVRAHRYRHTYYTWGWLQMRLGLTLLAAFILGMLYSKWKNWHSNTATPPSTHSSTPERAIAPPLGPRAPARDPVGDPSLLILAAPGSHNDTKRRGAATAPSSRGTPPWVEPARGPLAVGTGSSPSLSSVGSTASSPDIPPRRYSVEHKNSFVIISERLSGHVALSSKGAPKREGQAKVITITLLRQIFGEKNVEELRDNFQSLKNFCARNSAFGKFFHKLANTPAYPLKEYSYAGPLLPLPTDEVVSELIPLLTAPLPTNPLFQRLIQIRDLWLTYPGNIIQEEEVEREWVISAPSSAAHSAAHSAEGSPLLGPVALVRAPAAAATT